MMTSIPLLCNICPKEPEFSDISHLLTHVASKGHLAQELRAKVRSRQDASIREKLDVYDRWYERHQIEKLLSQRLILKESKDTSSRVKRSVKSPPARSIKNVKPRRKRSKIDDSVIIPQGSPFKSEEPPIDPQLSWFPPSSPSPFLSPPGHGGLPQYDQTSNHDYNIARIFDVQDSNANHQANIASTPSKNPSRPKSLLGLGPDTDSENDYFKTFIRSPTMTAYPDPSELPGVPFGFSPPQTSGRGRAYLTPDPNAGSFENADSIQPPVLKGVKWPGMSIFDSASLEAQRLRNQKKDGSILEQMEHNSSVVEQLERIYWPDGSLKIERLITGNVESSPMKEPTPPPKGQRTKTKKTVLKDLSTNVPRQTRRARKPPGQLHATQASDLRNISKKALATLGLPPPRFVYPRTAHMGYDAADEEDLERQPTSGNKENTRRREFDVFNDNVTTGDLKTALPGTRPAKSSAKIESKIESYPFLHDTHGHQDYRHLPRRTPFAPLRPSAGKQCRVQPDGLPWDTQPEAFTNIYKPSTAQGDSENIEPILDGDGRVDVQVSQAYNERVTQRYFSVAGNQPPQFFDSLPPHMEFGGYAGPKYYGSTLNLLNPYLCQQPLPPKYPPVLVHRPDPLNFTGRQENICKGGRPSVAKDEGSDEDMHSRP